MRQIIGLFVLLFTFLSACGTPVATEPVAQVQQVSTSITTLEPTFISQRQLPSKIPHCQGEPEYLRPGSSTRITVFALPASQSLAVYLDSNLVATGSANMDGYASIDILIPADEIVGPHQVSVYATGTSIIVTCQIQLWSDLIPSPTFQPAPTLTLQPTLSPNQLTMTATQQTLQERLGQYCWYGSALRLRLSPNGQWAEVNCEPDVIKIVSIDESKVWDVSSKGLIDPYTDHFVYVSHWSNDGTYVYVFVDPHTDGYWEFFHQGFVLYRLTLETGQIREVLPQGKSDWIFYSFAFSSNDRRLAYIVTDKSPVRLNIRDMQTGDEQSFEFDPKYNTGGSFIWSSDSQKLVFSVTQFDTSIYEDIATSIVLWDREKSDITILIKDDHEVLVPIEWNDETKIILQALYENDIKFEYDLTSGELTPINP